MSVGSVLHWVPSWKFCQVQLIETCTCSFCSCLAPALQTIKIRCYAHGSGLDPVSRNCFNPKGKGHCILCGLYKLNEETSRPWAFSTWSSIPHFMLYLKYTKHHYFLPLCSGLRPRLCIWVQRCFFSKKWKLRRNMPHILLAFLMFCFMWASNSEFWSMVTPISVSVSTSWIWYSPVDVLRW